MTSAPSAGSYPADFYAALHTGTPGDLGYYRRACAGANTVLELGCGDGRVLEALDAETTIRHGLDIHPGLLAAAETRLRGRVVLHAADMRSFDIDARFDRILLPFSGVYCLLEDADLEACLARVVQHLAPNGSFILDAYAADEFHHDTDPLDTGDRDWTEIGIVNVGDAPYSVFEQSTWDHRAQRIDVTYRHVPAGGDGGIVDGTIAQRYLLRDQLRSRLRAAGFTDIELAGGFEGEPSTATSEHWVAQARV